MQPKYYVIFSAAAIFMSQVAHADTAANAASNATTQSQAGANNAGNSQGITFNSGGDSTTHLDATPSVFVPNPSNSASQDNCDMLGTIGGSIINFGAAGSYVVHGERCDWRKDTRQTEQTASAYRLIATQEGITADGKKVANETAAKLLDVSQHMQCLNSDRQRAVMIKLNPNACKGVEDLATMDHRFNQPVNYGIDYAGRTSDDTPRVAGN
jgi:hypothetical protein